MTPEKVKEKKDRTDLGLELMRKWAKPGVRYSCEDIAAWCDCNPQNIQRIEKRAMKKLAAALKKAGMEKKELEKCTI
jgi:hypothetical protein